MSKFGFETILEGLAVAEQNFLHRAMNAAQKEIGQNFDLEKNSETGEGWEPVRRPTPPPILVRTGLLRSTATSPESVAYGAKRAILTINPIDEHGESYAGRHQEGENVAQREFSTQSESLTEKQTDILLEEIDKLFM